LDDNSIACGPLVFSGIICSLGMMVIFCN
jgi:hypothetical protein